MAPLPPRAVITADSTGPLVDIIAWLLLIVAFLAVVTRVVTKYVVSHRLGWDDAAIFCALALHVGQVTAASVAVSAGLGQHYGSLSSSQAETFQKALYASELLMVLNLALSKASVPVFLHHLSPKSGHRRAALIIGLVIALWSVISFIAAAAQCNAPRAWQVAGQNCFRQYAFWTFYNVVNVLSELAVLVLVIIVMWMVQVGRGRRLAIVGCFASRLTVVIAIICQMAYTADLDRSHPDPSFAWWRVETCVQFVQSLSITTACVPYIKAFYTNLESGMIRSDDLRRRQVPTSTFRERSERYTGHLGSFGRPQRFLSSNQARTSAQSLAEPILNNTPPPSMTDSARASPVERGVV